MTPKNSALICIQSRTSRPNSQTDLSTRIADTCTLHDGGLTVGTMTCSSNWCRLAAVIHRLVWRVWCMVWPSRWWPFAGLPCTRHIWETRIGPKVDPYTIYSRRTFPGRGKRARGFFFGIRATGWYVPGVLGVSEILDYIMCFHMFYAARFIIYIYRVYSAYINGTLCLS